MAFSQCAKPEETISIPNDAFLNALIELGVDTNGDGEISPSEAEAVTTLNVSRDTSITDMTGIEAFVNLRILNCSCNPLSSLDISNNVELLILRISYGASDWWCTPP